MIYKCYSPAGRSVLRKTVPKVSTFISKNRKRKLTVKTTDNLGIDGPLAFKSFMKTICRSARDISSLKKFHATCACSK